MGTVDAVEGYNGSSVSSNDRGDDWHFIEMLLNRGYRIGAIAVDDSHMHGQFSDFVRGWVHVKAASLTPESLLAALKNGHFYASTGPQLHNVEVIGRERVVIECSPAVQILVSGAAPRALRVNGHGLTAAEFDFSELETPWLRVTVRDDVGGRAWTNPVWLG